MLEGQKVVAVGGSSGIGLTTAAEKMGARPVEGKLWGAWRLARAGEDARRWATGRWALRSNRPAPANTVSPGTIDPPIRAAMPGTSRQELLASAAAALPIGAVGLGP